MTSSLWHYYISEQLFVISVGVDGMARKPRGTELWRKVQRRRGVYRFRAPIIAMTNIQLSDLNGQDAEAVRSRVMPIEIPSDPYVAWEYTVFLALTTDILLRNRCGQTVSLVKRSQVIKWFTSHVWKLDQVSPRRLKQVFDAFTGAKPHLLQDKLSLLLKPKAKWGCRQPPQQQDWSALRRELTATLPRPSSPRQVEGRVAA